MRPSVIEVTHKNSVFMVKKEPPRVARTVYVNYCICCPPLYVYIYWLSIGYNSAREKIKLSVSKVSEKEYAKMQHDVFALQKAGKC